MTSYKKYYSLIILCFFFSSNIFAQYINTSTCIGGNGDELIYPYPISDNNEKYSFKLNDNGSIYFLQSNSQDGDFAPNNGYNDLVVIKINANGEIGFTKNLGTEFYEKKFIVKQSKDASRYFIMTESYSSDSVDINGYIGEVTMQYKLFCIDFNGTVLWNKIIYNENKIFDNYSHSYHPYSFQLFLDQTDNCIVQYNKLALSANGRTYYNDSIIYTKIDRNGNTIWSKRITPFALYNNTNPAFQIDTFYTNTATFRNDFAETNNKYILSAYLSKDYYYPSFQSRNLLYSIDKANAEISSILIDSSYSFQATGKGNEFIIYGNFKKYIEDSSNTYAYFHYRKYDELLNKIYENEIFYNIPFESTPGFPSSYSKTTYCEAVPYYNNDSSKIWFSTNVNTSAIQSYYGVPITVETNNNTHANIINIANGELLQIVDLNKKNYNFFVKIINNTFYYFSFDTLNVFDSTSITAYSFDGTELRTKNGINGVAEYNEDYLINNFNNIDNSIVYYNNQTLSFFVLDTLFNVIMQGLLDTTTYPIDFYNYLSIKYNLHILDTNRYCVLQSIWQDTLTGCYPNTNNILFNLFSKENIVSSIKTNIKNNLLNIYPNPNNGNFTIDFTSKGNYPITISLFDVTGKIIYQQNMQHNNKSLIQIADDVIAAGIYNLQISSTNDVWNKKVMITR